MKYFILYFTTRYFIPQRIQHIKTRGNISSEIVLIVNNFPEGAKIETRIVRSDGLSVKNLHAFLVCAFESGLFPRRSSILEVSHS